MKILNYSWKDFGTVILVLALIYYLVIFYLRHQRQMKSPVQNRQVDLDDDFIEPEIIDPFSKTARLSPEQTEELNFQQAERLIGHIKRAIPDYVDRELGKEEMLEELRGLMAGYPGIEDDILRRGITELILSQCKIHGSIMPSRSEVEQLWTMV
ncbi:hypothetical protein [Chitinophaga sp. Ak27]|uniref:hypothetical protein n=1 Tax=Chitinophaga sp. Ak27 TaxID=2726116 RepID=UPI00145E3247|nr:hypothetical protein [Chitinophaga sp. Ak27]NLU94859.1 hypothetical protein [Chitinophaga sp. Ak27]